MKQLTINAIYTKENMRIEETRIEETVEPVRAMKQVKQGRIWRMSNLALEIHQEAWERWKEIKEVRLER